MKTITEYGLGLTLADGKNMVSATYQFSVKPNFEESEITLIKVGNLNNPEKSLSDKTKEGFKKQIMEVERERQQTIFSATQNFNL